MQSDSELVNAVLDGNKDAFAILVKRYERPVRAVALAVVGDHHLAADVSQDAFVKAYEALAGLRKPGAFGPWLMKITRRCALNFVRRDPKEAQLEPAAAGILENPDGQLDEDEQALLAAVVRLPEAERQVVMLRYFAGHSVKDVAGIRHYRSGRMPQKRQDHPCQGLDVLSHGEDARPPRRPTNS